MKLFALLLMCNTGSFALGQSNVTGTPVTPAGGRVPAAPASLPLLGAQPMPSAPLPANSMGHVMSTGELSGPGTSPFISVALAQTVVSTAAPVFPADAVPITRQQAEATALKNNPRITASRLLALAAGQVTRETRANELPQIEGYLTAVKAEDASRIGAGELNSSRLYTHAGTGGTLQQLLTDFGHTRDLVANTSLLARAQGKTVVATEQDVLLATDQAFYRLLNAQSLLRVAQATVQARGSVQNLTQALTKSALKSDLDLNIASADLSQSQLLELDAENDVASASAALAALLAAPAETFYQAVEEDGAVSPPPIDAATLTKLAQTQRPDLQALQLNVQAYGKLARAQELQYLPSISALATGGSTPVRPDGVFAQNWYAAAGVNLSIPLFTGFRIDAQAKEARLRGEAVARQAADLSNNISRDVQVATRSAQTAFRRIGVTEDFSREAARALSLAQTRYKLGLSSIVELSQAQLQSTQAAVSVVNARYDYLLALRTLDYTEGRLAP